MSAAQAPDGAAKAPLDLALEHPADRRFNGELVRFSDVLPRDAEIEPGPAPRRASAAR